MKILKLRKVKNKKTKPKKPVYYIFKCERCGCVVECTRGEVRVDIDYREDIVLGCSHTTYWYDCPKCNETLIGCEKSWWHKLIYEIF